MKSRNVRLTAWACVIGILATGCQLPNPYTYPSKPSPPQPSTPPSGEPPEVPPQPEATPTPEEPVPPPPERKTREYQLGPASKALVAQAQTQAAEGDLVSASATLERALRIEPSNPLLWLELGKVRQQEGNDAQAESLGRKALSLATGDARVQSRAWTLIAEALRARGRVVQARDAEQKAAELTPR